MSVLRLLILADDPLARAGLAAMLDEQAGIEVVGRISGADDVQAALATCRPDVLLWDLGWHSSDALERLPDVVEMGTPLAVLMSDEAGATAAWAAGVRGVLARDAAPDRIVAALSALAHGLVAAEPALAAAFSVGTSQGRSGPDEPALVEELTARELEVLRLIADGLPNKTIAQRLNISEHTVKFHVNSILGKLGAGGRTEAVVRATRLGLIRI